MKLKILALSLLLGLAISMPISVSAQQLSEAVIYFYGEGQAVPVLRSGRFTADRQADAEILLDLLLAGPTPEEQARGLTSPLPAGTELVAVMVSGDEVTVNLRLPPGFLEGGLDATRSDAIVDQIVKTLHPLDLRRFHIRSSDERGTLAPLSDAVPRAPVPRPTVPPNDDPAPDRMGPPPAPDAQEPEYTGQPPAFGQGQPQGALSGKTVWLSAGHGWYWSDTLSRWNTQRGNNYGLVEDFSNAEAVNYYLARYLWNAGAEVWLVRERSMNEHEVVVDNDDGLPAYAEGGAWATSSTPGYAGGTYRFANTYSTLSATATWRPELPAAGWYAVWAWYREGINRTIDARYEVHHAGGLTTVHISQEIHGQTWRYLGEYYFEAGTDGHVTLLNASDDPDQAVIADAIRFGGGLGSIVEPGGTSGEPRWEEAAKYWAQFQGAPPEVYESDVTARPLYAEWESAKGYPGEAENAVYISWHTNAGGGTGTDSFIHDTTLPPGSVELQDWVHGELIRDLRAAWDPLWVNRGQHTADFGEVRELSIIPGLLLEVAFHDTEDPGDADDLREPLFRQIAARAVYQGIVKYHAAREGQILKLLPEPPTHLLARTTGAGEVTLTWRAPSCCDGVGGDAASAYKVYQSTDGRAFDDGTETVDPSLTLTGLPAGTLRFFRVTALNAGGESFPTPVVAVRTPPEGESPAFLVVDGFDRLDQSALIPQWESPALGTAQRMFLERMNRYDHAVEHGQALATCGLAFDGAVNEAVQDRDVALAGYAAVDWFVGEESVVDGTLGDAERARLAAYLDGGGRLLISGSDIGYDLVENGRDPGFYQDYLRAAYLGDDAGTYHFFGMPEGRFEGLAGRFGDGTGGTYDVGYPDRLAPVPGAGLALLYDGGTADGAAIVYPGAGQDAGSLVHVGFPLETVTDAATRADLFCAAAGYLLPIGGPDLAFHPDRSSEVAPGGTAVYTHTLRNLGSAVDTINLTAASSQGWMVDYDSPLTLAGGLATTVAISVAVPAEVPNGTVDVTVLTASSALDPQVQAVVAETTTVVRPPAPSPEGIPRLIDPGFEQGTGQSAWLSAASDGNPIFHQRDDLPGGVTPHGGDWVAWLGGYNPGTMATTALTQTVALPSGEPMATLTLAWLAHPVVTTPSAGDSLTAGIYDLAGTLLIDLLHATGDEPADTWQEAAFELSPFAGETIQLAFRAESGNTAFFLDDVELTTSGPPGPDEFRALWVDAYHEGIKSPQQIDELVETAQAGNFNALVVQVRRRGDTYYPSDLDPWAADTTPGFDALAYLIERAHVADIEVHAWATTLAIWGGSVPPVDPEHTWNVHGPGATDRDYWLMTSYTGEDKPGDLIYYLDPGHPDVVDYTVAIYAELASRYDLDGLHLDRIRYPEQKGSYCQDSQVWYCQDWGYNPTSVARFLAQTGRSEQPDPLDAAWVQWRRDQVTALVRRIYLATTAINPRLRVSAATVTSGSPPTDLYPWETRTPYIHHLQDWRGWLEEGVLDLSLAMTYRDQDLYPGQFDGWIEWQKDHQYGRGAVVGTGLYLNDLADSMVQWLLTRQPSTLDNLALGYSGYSYASPSDTGVSRRTFVNASVTDVLTRSASVPAIPWKDTPTLGHLAGRLVQEPPCFSLDGHAVTLAGPVDRLLLSDGSGWFGAVDLPPGEYLLTVEVPAPDVTIDLPVLVVAGTVAEGDILLPGCTPGWHLYLPLVLRQTNP